MNNFSKNYEQSDPQTRIGKHDQAIPDCDGGSCVAIDTDPSPVRRDLSRRSTTLIGDFVEDYKNQKYRWTPIDQIEPSFEFFKRKVDCGGRDPRECYDAVMQYRRTRVFGVNDVQGASKTKLHNHWSQCLHRVFQHVDYVDTRVDFEWLFFSLFQKWGEKHYVEGWHIDKDFMGENKYGPDSAMFVSPHENATVAGKRTRRNRELLESLRKQGR